MIILNCWPQKYCVFAALRYNNLRYLAALFKAAGFLAMKVGEGRSVSILSAVAVVDD